MNLHGIVRGAITVVNQDVLATLRRSTGYTISPDGTQIPAYADTPDIAVQVQAASSDDIRQLDGLNIQGIRRVAYLNGSAMGVVRNLQVGGDLFIFPAGVLPEGDTWLVAHVMEQWGPGSEWCKVALVLQAGS
jgi:hypothetical protein